MNCNFAVQNVAAILYINSILTQYRLNLFLSFANERFPVALPQLGKPLVILEKNCFYCSPALWDLLNHLESLIFFFFLAHLHGPHLLQLLKHDLPNQINFYLRKTIGYLSPIPLTLFRVGIFRAAHWWGVPKGSPFLKSVTHILQWWKSNLT